VTDLNIRLIITIWSIAIITIWLIIIRFKIWWLLWFNLWLNLWIYLYHL